MTRKAYLIAGALTLATLGSGLTAVALAHQAAPVDLDRSLARTTRSGAFQVRIEPAERPIPLHKVHRWNVSVSDRAGRPVDNAVIRVDGGMPQHGHGLPTKPVAVAGPTTGTYLINGMKFSMDGWWEIKLEITAGDVSDGVTFNLVL